MFAVRMLHKNYYPDQEFSFPFNDMTCPGLSFMQTFSAAVESMSRLVAWINLCWFLLTTAACEGRGFKQLSNPLSWTKWEKSGMARRSELVDVWVTGPWLFILTTHSSPHGRLSAEVSMADCPLQNTSATKHRRNQTKLAEKLIVSWQLHESVTRPSWFTTAAPLLWNHVDRQHLLQQIPCH